MSKFRRNCERFFLHNRSKGIRNLMLYVVIARIVVYFVTMIDPSGSLYGLLVFSPSAILRGQVWRLFSFILLPDSSNILLFALSAFFLYYMGRMLENSIGTLKLNLYYLGSILVLDAAGILLSLTGPIAELYICSYMMLFLDLSMLLAFAALHSDVTVRIFYIIPIRMKYLSWLELAYLIYYAISMPFPAKLFTIAPLIPFFLFFSSEAKNLLPDAWRYRRRAPKQKKSEKPNPDWAKNYRGKDGQKPYHHKCTVCGRTDADYPDLEFRYCSRCKGYYCYCIDHINNHVHITE